MSRTKNVSKQFNDDSNNIINNAINITNSFELEKKNRLTFRTFQVPRYLVHILLLRCMN